MATLRSIKNKYLSYAESLQILKWESKASYYSNFNFQACKMFDDVLKTIPVIIYKFIWDKRKAVKLGTSTRPND